MAESKQVLNRFDGVVKWFKPRRGFGFITPCDESKEDLFVHQSEIMARGYRTLFDGDYVEFSLCEDHEGRVMASQVLVRERNVQVTQGACYNCGQSGHYARDCIVNVSNNGGNNNDGTLVKKSRACYNCGVDGHFARDCSAPDTRVRPSNNNGGNNNGENVKRSDQKCYNCGVSGHFARDCVEARKVVNGGNNNGEMRTVECYNCGVSGHFARDCLEARKVVNGGNNNGEMRKVECYNCGKIGHYARECRNVRKN